VIYAFLVDGLDFERREEFDRALNGPATTEHAKANREREAVQSLMNIPGVVGGR
jgi:hypothetical protein